MTGHTPQLDHYFLITDLTHVGASEGLVTRLRLNYNIIP